MSPIPQSAPTAKAAEISPAVARVLARTPGECFRHGVIQALPFMLVILPFGLLFGVVATEAGLDIVQTMSFSILVLAGASQFTAVQLLADQAPTIVIILSALAVNLRLAMYSASMVPWIGAASPRTRGIVAYLLIDQTYALSVQEYEKYPDLTIAQRLGYFLGTCLVCCLPWSIATYFGATIGSAIPESWALDFVIPITFLAMIAPILRTLAHLAAALVAIVAALVFSFMPSGTGMLIAAPLGMVTGALVETWTERQKARDAGHV